MNEGGQAKKIEDRWFNRHSSCPDPNNKVSSNSLKLESFWGLFLIAGVASSVALLIFAGTFLYEHKDMLMSSDSEDSLWKRIRAILKQYDLKDHNSHTFRHELAESVYDAQRTPSPRYHTEPQSPRETQPQPAREIQPQPAGEIQLQPAGEIQPELVYRPRGS